MIKINLIPPEALEKEAKKRFVILIAIGAGTIVTLAIFFFMIRFTIDKTLSITLNNVEIQITKYQVAVDEVKRLRGLTSSLETRKNVIENLMKGRLDYPKFMEVFLELLPSSIWLSTMGLNNTAEGFNININCTSIDGIAVADFVSNLETHKDFSGVEIGAISSSGGEKETFSFPIKCTYKPPKDENQQQ